MSSIASNAEDLILNADGGSSTVKIKINGTEKASISSAGAFTSTTIDATKLTGNLPAISGAALTGISSVGGATGVDFNDNVKIRLGTGNDAEIYHDGTHTYYKNSHTSGSTRFNQKYFEVNNTAGTESMLSAYEDGAVTLRYNGVSKLLTQANGIQINGDIEIGTHPFAITGEGGSDRLTIQENTGNVWIDGNCSAASFTDRTPYPETLQIAYDVINSHKKLPDGQYKADDESKQLDHSQLHEYVSLTTPSTLWTENDNLPDGVSVGDVKKEEEKSRNMSGVISCLVEVIKDLSTKNTALETRITTLEG